MYRLHIDLPMGDEQEMAIGIAESLLQELQLRLAGMHIELGVRLMCDSDRSKRNYLEQTPSGHWSNSKTKIQIK